MSLFEGPVKKIIYLIIYTLLAFVRRQSLFLPTLVGGGAGGGRARIVSTHFFRAYTCTHSPAYGDSKLLTRAIEGKEENSEGGEGERQ